MNAEHEFLASAYLDGELTAEERRVAEADPAVMAEVEQLRALRAGLAAPEPASDASRESAIAAAMSAFHEVHGAPGGGTAPAEPRVVPFGERFDARRWLGIAAAVVVIGLLGVVAASGLGGNGGDDSDSADMAAEPVSDEPADEATAATAGGDSALIESQDAADESEAPAAADAAEADEPALSFADEPADEDAGAADDRPESGSADDSATEDTEVASELAADESDDGAAEADEAVDAARLLDELPIRSEIELSAVGQYLLELIDRRELPPTPEHSCPFPNVLADASYRDDTGTAPDGEPIDVYIAVNTEFGTVVAIDSDTCTVLLRTDLEP